MRHNEGYYYDRKASILLFKIRSSSYSFNEEENKDDKLENIQ